MQPIISVQNLSKSYLIGRNPERAERYKSLRDAISTGAQNAIQRLANLLSNRGSVSKSNSKLNEFWALEGISFEVKTGEVVGIIGRNGAGKSTLLKVLSRITEPSGGRVVLRGKVASLLEVGTGFHPELTGRENIFLNGAILGMSRSEIKSKFDQIVDFAEIEKFLNTPVKRYSSGMYVRLAFSVAAHLDPEVLVVDEVLAVGDAQFQNKCLGRMHEVAREGRTVLFVSHNMGILRKLCARGIVLRQGKCIFDGDIAAAIACSLEDEGSRSAEWRGTPPQDQIVGFTRIFASTIENQPVYSLSPENPWLIHFEYQVVQPCSIQIAFRMNSDDGTTVFSSAESDAKAIIYEKRLPGKYHSTVEIPGHFLAPGKYSILAAANQPNGSSIEIIDRPIEFEVSMAGSLKQNDNRWGWFCPRLNWNTHSVPVEAN